MTTGRKNAVAAVLLMKELIKPTVIMISHKKRCELSPVARSRRRDTACSKAVRESTTVMINSPKISSTVSFANPANACSGERMPNTTNNNINPSATTSAAMISVEKATTANASRMKTVMIS